MNLRASAAWCHRRRRLVLIAWVSVLAATWVVATIVDAPYSSNFSPPRSESARAYDLLRSRFPAYSGDSITVVFHSQGGLDVPGVQARAERVLHDLGELPHVVAEPVSPWGAGRPYQMAKDGRTAFALVQLDGRTYDVPPSVPTDAIRLADAASTAGLQVELGGQAIARIEQQKPQSTEAIGLVAAIVVLLIVFGSLLASAFPIVVALFGLGLALGIVRLVAAVAPIPDFAAVFGSMIGLGVGIDYALFIVTRYRQVLADGADEHDAIVRSVATAGRSVLFAGACVVVSLMGMFLMGLGFVYGIAIASITAVACMVVASLTLLPSLLGFAGRNIDRFRLPVRASVTSSRLGGWSRLISRRPIAGAVAAAALLGILAAPLAAMRLGTADAGNDPSRFTTRRAYDLLSSGFGEGFNGPLLLAVHLHQNADATVGSVVGAVGSTPGVASVLPPLVNDDGSVAAVFAIPATAPQDARTDALVRRLRSSVLPAFEPQATIDVGGITATFIDFGAHVGARLPIAIAAVLIVSFFVLLALFRAVMVAVKASLMNLASIAAAYGVVVAVFQWGWGRSLIGVEREGPIEAWVPLMLFTILFGLSMDYEVLLLSRIRELHDTGLDNRTAVEQGLASTGRVIVAAAAVMVVVFGAFVLSDLRVLKIFGLGMAAAIVIDATVVRLLLLPATMELLGEANWWAPRWLLSRLPSFEVEAQIAIEDQRTPAPALPGS